ncbi:phytochrome-like protein cph2 [mine drainage metagenome]|uniref:Phytochrome-like protein cph2 n=1 Tax=mine drainage metagenome TaxID=410659 RepID=A0A1J5RJ93_9ZZZZ
MLESACAQARAWQDAGLPQLRMAVNISARQFRHKGLVDAIGRVLERTGLAAGLLEVEITESMAMHDPEETIRLLDSLKERGLRIALDDFGTGFSSLSYLKRFPIDVLKIDQSFVAGIARDRSDAAIARTVIGLARNLGLQTIAEGVETVEQGGLLRAWACDDAQGYHFSLPLGAEDATVLMQQGRRFTIGEFPGL